MGGSDRRKKSKKSKRAKREKAAKKARAAAEAAAAIAATAEEQQDAETGLSLESQAVVIELQRTELSRLLREQQRLNDRIDQLMRLHEREQVLRQQMQAALDKLAEQRALPAPVETDADRNQLMARVDRAESRFTQLQSAVGLLVTALERRMQTA